MRLHPPLLEMVGSFLRDGPTSSWILQWAPFTTTATDDLAEAYLRALDCLSPYDYLERDVVTSLNPSTDTSHVGDLLIWSAAEISPGTSLSELEAIMSEKVLPRIAYVLDKAGGLDPLVNLLAEQLDCVMEVDEAGGASTMGDSHLPMDDDAHLHDLGLKELSEYICDFHKSFLLWPRKDIMKMANECSVPCGFGSRAQMLGRLITESVRLGQQERIIEVLTEFIRSQSFKASLFFSRKRARDILARHKMISSHLSMIREV